MTSLVGVSALRVDWTKDTFTGMITFDIKTNDLVPVTLVSLELEENKLHALTTALTHISAEIKELSPQFRATRVDYEVLEQSGIIRIRDIP